MMGGEKQRTAVQGRGDVHTGSEAAGLSGGEQIIIQGVGLGRYARRRIAGAFGRSSWAPQCHTTPPGKGDRVGPLETDYAAASTEWHWQRTRAKHDEHVKPETGAADGAREA